jgi:hypothetical protein
MNRPLRALSVLLVAVLLVALPLLSLSVVPAKSNPLAVSFGIQLVSGAEDEDSIWGEFQVIVSVYPDVTRLQFCIDNIVISEQNRRENDSILLLFYFRTGDYPEGTHVISVRAYDAMGAMATAQVIRVFDSSMTAPLAAVRVLAAGLIVLGIALGLFIAQREGRLEVLVRDPGTKTKRFRVLSPRRFHRSGL